MDMPRMRSVTPASPALLTVEWADGAVSTINLIGWITTGGDLLSPLASAQVWATARVEDFGATLAWDGPDLAIDAYHLHQIAKDQRDFGLDDLKAWQEAAGLSNNEAADFLGVSLRTWNNYRSGAPISNAVKMLLRASQRDPLLMHAHYRPRRPGRPKHVA
jgi:hypothetical protein